MGAITDSLDGITGDKQRSRVKAAALATAAGTQRTWRIGTRRIVVRDIRSDDTALCFRLRVEDGDTVSFEDDVRVVNPPIMVPTGEVKQATWGTVPICEERPLEAVRTIILDLIAARVR
jgi:hypothetical protein